MQQGRCNKCRKLWKWHGEVKTGQARCPKCRTVLARTTRLCLDPVHYASKVEVLI